MTDDCFQSLVGCGYSAIVGSRGPAVVGGYGELPPPPPVPGHWEEQQPTPKSRSTQPSYPPPKMEIKVEKAESEEESVFEVPGQDWEISSVPDAPPLNGPKRPAFVQCVRHWLETNLSTYELATLLG